jgi:hypothetical protein
VVTTCTSDGALDMLICKLVVSDEELFSLIEERCGYRNTIGNEMLEKLKQVEATLPKLLAFSHNQGPIQGLAVTIPISSFPRTRQKPGKHFLRTTK